jgi:hypothetical protein
MIALLHSRVKGVHVDVYDLPNCGHLRGKLPEVLGLLLK